jgi:hypothetical protein
MPQGPGSVLRSLPAPPPRRWARTRPQLGMAGRFGSGRERPSPRFGSHRLPRTAARPRLPLARLPSLDARAPRRTGCADSLPEGLESKAWRPRTRGAIRAARALTPTDRCADVAIGARPDFIIVEGLFERSAQYWYPAPHWKRIRTPSDRPQHRARPASARRARRRLRLSAARTHRSSSAHAPKPASGSLG